MFLSIPYKIIFLIIAFAIFFGSCETEPPVTPVLPDVVGFKVRGDDSLDYVSIKGFISVLSGSINQFQFSSVATINNESYALVLSVFPNSKQDTSEVYKIVQPGDSSSKENYAYALFITGYNTNHEVEYWAFEGSVNLSITYIGKSINSLKGNFIFNATAKDTAIKQISVSDGWIDFTRIF
jgi:hypothetical protein